MNALYELYIKCVTMTVKYGFNSTYVSRGIAKTDMVGWEFHEMGI